MGSSTNCNCWHVLELRFFWSPTSHSDSISYHERGFLDAFEATNRGIFQDATSKADHFNWFCSTDRIHQAYEETLRRKCARFGLWEVSDWMLQWLYAIFRFQSHKRKRTMYKLYCKFLVFEFLIHVTLVMFVEHSWWYFVLLIADKQRKESGASWVPYTTGCFCCTLLGWLLLCGFEPQNSTP